MKQILALLTALPSLAAPLQAQAPLDPPGAPAPTMKSLQEIWSKLEEIEEQNALLDRRMKNQLLIAPAPGFPIEFVDVLNAGNVEDPLNSASLPGIGAVSYPYRIGKYEVTNTQYAAFLNAVARADTNGLYHSQMGSSLLGGITQSGTSPRFVYAVKANMGNKPVNWVNQFDAIRFCNWLHNGQLSGAQDRTTTEDGAYALTGPWSVGVGSDPMHGANGRNSGAEFHLPSESEWYKAAYHQPAGGAGGDADGYWLYPTRSNTDPTTATADALGNINNDTANIANFGLGADWNGQGGNVTTVGSGGLGSASYYGAFDMGGNLGEWNEQISGKHRVRGGSFSEGANSMQSSFTFPFTPFFNEQPVYGFRVAAPDWRR